MKKSIAEMDALEAKKNGTRFSKSEQAYLKIQSLILHNELKPGQPINEVDLASIIQISRTPIHEAIRKLEMDGLVMSTPKGRNCVTYFTDEMIQKIGYLRAVLDSLAIRMAMYNGSDADFAALKEIAAYCEECDDKGDLYGRITADRQFHLRIAEISKNEVLVQQEKRLYMQIHLLQLQYFEERNDKSERVKCHQQIIKYLSNREVDKAIKCQVQRIADIYNLDPALLNFSIAV